MNGGRQGLMDDAAELGVELPDSLVSSADFAIFPENVEAVSMFDRMATQWRIGFNGRLGLDYSALPFLLTIYPVNDPRQLFEDLQVMEVAVLQEQS